MVFILSGELFLSSPPGHLDIAVNQPVKNTVVFVTVPTGENELPSLENENFLGQFLHFVPPGDGEFEKLPVDILTGGVFDLKFVGGDGSCHYEFILTPSQSMSST
jgi:hypothetical protein